MDLQTITYLVVGASFALYIGIAIWARAGSTSEFYAAGGSVHPITNGMATAADWISAASFISPRDRRQTGALQRPLVAVDASSRTNHQH